MAEAAAPPPSCLAPFSAGSSLAPWEMAPPPGLQWKVRGTQLWPPATRLTSVSQVSVSSGSRSVRSLETTRSRPESATEILESCPTQASRDPSGEKLTEWIQPPPLFELENSARSCPIGILVPQEVAEGLASISLM